MTGHSQRGVALLTILLLVVSITVVAGSMLASQKVAIRRSGLLFDQNQLLQDINAGQQLAITMIRADSKLNDTDSEQDIWAQPIPPYALANHSISIELRDESGRFNLNNLYQNGAADPVALAIFQRLLTQLNLEVDIAVAVLDYQDTDSDVYQDGGDESAVYAQQSNGTAQQKLPNQPFVSVDQLQEVRGVSAEVLAALRPYVTAVPYYVPINVNTASPVLLAALVDGATSQQMQGLVDMRETQALTAIDELWQLPSLSGLDEAQRTALAPLLAVDSSAFLALVTASDNVNNTGQTRQRFATILISKMAADNGRANNTGSNSGNSNNNSSTNNNAVNSSAIDGKVSEEVKKEVKIVTQRLWAFRPSF
ncbi:type II secretion system minor pseudopilin GspK [Psychrobacter sp. NG254]|uniref:type II secretion system minor pseudopilin GspK n=1 Tax=Psychrobacter sp. NG254 TaxID=2782003 RepID=UPI001888310A|nr:type II secretion system minor pseudopilin GspK [Psychrobacter sp. NG254]MBF2718528.1 type II secretion system minor pseudopilin GspK [Psychrobacter sp. NG254]